ncbi:Uncharacterised protein [Vibrio cholerae]|nr:Uncharacterised protein [Vibrio cholerae]CSI87054.1 Uncharacterised protein [Vibrio cholerae]
MTPDKIRAPMVTLRSGPKMNDNAINIITAIEIG